MARTIVLGLGGAAILVFAAAACGSSAGTPDDGASGGETDSGTPIDHGATDGGDPGTDEPDAGPDDDGDDGGDGAAVLTTTYAASLAAGGDMACVVTKGAKELRCWGASQPLTALAPGSAWKAVSVGGSISEEIAACGIRTDDSLWCWSSLSKAMTQPDTGAFEQVGVASGNRCAIATTGALYCWGSNNVFGPLGTGDALPRDKPTPIGGDMDWEMVAPGGDHTCAIKTSGALYCWGWDAFGEVGDGDAVNTTKVPVAIDAAHTYVDVSTKATESCGVRADGALLCWGSGVAAASSTEPEPVDSAKNWTKVRLSLSHVCALKSDGSLYCWGSNDRGQLGIPVAAGNLSRTSPQRVGADLDWVDVAVGDGFTCATKKDARVWCWGSNGSGQLAQDPPGHLTPKQIGAAADFASIGAGPNNVCAVKKDGSLACWGLGGGSPTSGVAAQAPVAIGAATDWETVKPGYAGACATKTDDALYCWKTGAPPASTGLTVSTYDVGYAHQCAIVGDSLYCWGAGIFGKLGNGSDTSLPTPTKVGTDSWSDVGTSIHSTCGIKTDGTMTCFGFGYTDFEQQGAATNWSAVDAPVGGHDWYGLQGAAMYRWRFALPPSAYGGVNDWTAIAPGLAHVCGIRAGGTLWCAGDNSRGQLGDGTLVDKSAPVQVGAASDWTHVTSGSNFTCGLRGGGDLYCWGSNDYGEQGDGTSWKSDPSIVP